MQRRRIAASLFALQRFYFRKGYHKGYIPKNILISVIFVFAISRPIW